MDSDWQSWAAIGAVALTGAIFVIRYFFSRKQKDSHCDHGCGCGKPSLPEPPKRKT